MINNQTTANESTGLTNSTPNTITNDSPWMTIGTDLTIVNFFTKQRGYGRQSLYLIFKELDKEYYYRDVFPNVEEDFDILLRMDAAYDEENDYYTDSNGNGEYTEEEVYESIIDALQTKLNGMTIEIE